MASRGKSVAVGVVAEVEAVVVARKGKAGQVAKAADLRPKAALRPSMHDRFRPGRPLPSKLALHGRKQPTTRMRGHWLVLRTRIPARQ